MTPHDEVYTVLEDFVIPISCQNFNQVTPHQKLLQIAEKTAGDKTLKREGSGRNRGKLRSNT